MIAATVYDWLRAQGLWPAALNSVLYWAIPLTLGWLLGRRVLGRLVRVVRGEWRQAVALLRQHNDTQAQLARAHEEQAEHLAAIAARLEGPPQREETP